MSVCFSGFQKLFNYYPQKKKKNNYTTVLQIVKT